MKNIMEILDKLRFKGFDYSTVCVEYNPMETFVKYVSTKEIVHSRIIAELLNPNGSHHLGSRFLESFLAYFYPKYEDFDMKNVQITTERYIPSNRRKIDIFIEWGNNRMRLSLKTNSMKLNINPTNWKTTTIALKMKVMPKYTSFASIKIGNRQLPTSNLSTKYFTLWILLNALKMY